MASSNSGESSENSTSTGLLCSVLNVVIDHSMESPTPLEPLEFEQTKSSKSTGQPAIQVPVLRIFGPLIRDPSIGPLQSACLHIHGAYPYLLARPTLAGPDGSINRETPQTGHVDWDDIDSVERIAQSLHSALEEAIQSLDRERQGWLNADSKKAPASEANKNAELPVIRAVSVVQGRGFYTYCPGPPAPFLRVEYYNPKLRWKVKLVLERGLQVPMAFYPDPHQYDRVSTQEDNSLGIDSDSLRFHCYEAHIPYTMQFFKDWNLSGMAYLKVDHALFRSVPDSCAFVRYRKGAFDEECDSKGLFLKSNTHEKNLWVESVSEGVEPPRKTTSADLELDCTVQNLRNIDTVMKTMPSDLDERDKVQWRAVPSLKEIWQQERCRMSKLLQPEKDFLTHPELQPDPESLPMTLDVKRGAERPGAALAAKGMKSLVGISYRLEENFQRALQQILLRHKKAVERADRGIRKKLQLSTPESSTKRPGISTMTPDWNEAIEALESLAEGSRNPPKDDLVDHINQIHSHSNAVESPMATRSGAATNLLSSTSGDSPAGLLPNQVLSYPSSQELQHGHKPDLTLLDNELCSQRLERGDPVLPAHATGGRAMEDCIDPDTLAPFDELDFGEERCRAKFKVATDSGETWRICGNIASRCMREGHEGSVDRALPGQYKTVTTGTFVDGVFDTSCQEDDEEQDRDTFENLLTMLATQVAENRKKSTPSQSISNKFDRGNIVRPMILDGVGNGDSAQSESEEEVGVEASAEHLSTGPKHELKDEGGLGRQSTATLEPPLRGEVLLPSTSLYPVESRTTTMSWLVNASKWESQMKGTKVPQNDAPICDHSRRYVHPVQFPPTRQRVMRWCRKRRSVPEEHCNKRARSDGQTGRKRSCDLAALRPQQMEEVQWHPSQAMHLSLTQQSQAIDENNVVPERSEGETSLSSVANESSKPTVDSQSSHGDALEGIGAQGGRIHVQGGGTLKAKVALSQAPIKRRRNTDSMGTSEYMPTPLSFMSVETHVQCRSGTSRLDSKRISMAADSSKDRIFAIVFIYGIDPGGGESLKVLERFCLFVHFEREKSDRSQLASLVESSMPNSNMGASAPLKIECLQSEKKLLMRFSSLVRLRDPDLLVSWDTQGAGLGYIIERGSILSGGNSADDGTKPSFDIVSLLGRTPSRLSGSELQSIFPLGKGELPTEMSTTESIDQKKWKGSGLGNEWDERVGAGAAAASIVGRLVFSGWKIVAEEVKHKNYSYLPAVVAAVLNKRIPCHSDLTLTQWYSSEHDRWRVLHHRLNQAVATLLLFDALDIVGRAGEAARLSGVDFSQSFPGIRGSQYKVEGVLLRALQSLRSDERGSRAGRKRAGSPKLSRDATNLSSFSNKSSTQSPWKLRRGINDNSSSPESRHYFFYSPSLEDTGKQEALEVQALTLEPLSGHYKEPVVVCDFTALYPSLMIAYNLCYSTCAGKLEYHSTREEMQVEGRTTGKLGPFEYPERRTATVLNHHLKSLNNKAKESIVSTERAYTAPTGTIYVSEDVLKGVLPQVLDEILTTRAMLKRAAKEYKKHVKDLSPAILRQLEARQLALKYVANVTYGYTSATFSGRCAMPLLADTIVECGRKTLTKAINMANQWGQGEKWKGARVIYGDTDSLFVKLPGRSYKEAFDFGEELCKAVTDDNPPPVQLKLEKVYLGSIMQTMKRYCGMKFESRDQKKPTFEAKGLETIRRDQCALTQKVLKNALVTLFRDGIEAVKDYLYRQWSQIESGQLPVSDFILTGRVRSKYRGGKEGPVQAVLAKRMNEADPGRIIRHKERLPYVIVATPGVNFRLKDCVLTPLELMERWDAYTIHAAYYIERHVNAALQRCLGLAPHMADVAVWYQARPKPRKRIHFWPVRSRSRAMITTYFGSDVCSLCGRVCQASGRDRVVVCEPCRQDKVGASHVALLRLNKVEERMMEVAKQCSQCNGCFEDGGTFAVLKPQYSTNMSMNKISACPDGDALQIPLANCICIDCPNTFERHRLREQMIEDTATCEVLNLL